MKYLLAVLSLLLLGAGCTGLGPDENIVVDVPEAPPDELLETYPFIILTSGSSENAPPQGLVAEGYGNMYLYESGKITGNGFMYYVEKGDCALEHLEFQGYECMVTSAEDADFEIRGSADETGQAFISLYYYEKPYEYVVYWPSQDPDATEGNQSTALYYIQEELGLFEDFPVYLAMDEVYTFETENNDNLTILSIQDYELVDAY